MTPTRRDFLRGMAALGLAATPGILVRAASRIPPRGDAPGRLVVVQLTGGNDGLNTIIPYDDDRYHRARPTLAVARSEALPLDGAGDLPLGLHPSMRPLLDVWSEGDLAIVPGVGYDNPSRSHFRSMDIWHTARPDLEAPVDGWVGRALGREDAGLEAMFVGAERLPLALTGSVPVPSIQNIDFLDFLSTPSGRRMRDLLRGVNSTPRRGRAEAVRALAEVTTRRLEKLLEVRGRGSPVTYPDTRLAGKLEVVGQLIAAGLPERVYYATQGGYDTHADQGPTHGGLLAELSGALEAFWRHVRAIGESERVAVLVFSEFGRRVRENGSLGTDHGAAAPVLIVSGRARGGAHGEFPDLGDLDGGDLRHRVDFRRVYATLLDGVLGVEPGAVLGPGFAPLELFEETRRARI